MTSLRRQQLVSLDAAGWRHAVASAHDAPAQSCLSFWADQQLPLVVTQQQCGITSEAVRLGLPAPQRWGRRRIAVQMHPRSLSLAGGFPTLRAVTNLLPPAMRPDVETLAAALHALGVEPRVYGSFGWQQLTGMDYIHADSDVDLELPVPDAAVADAVVAALRAARFAAPRLDGELRFPDGSAVAWREWLQWRSRAVDRVLVKRLQGVTMERGDTWLREAQSC